MRAAVWCGGQVVGVMWVSVSGRDIKGEDGEERGSVGVERRA
ncbi:hypothetical protein [Bartonella sp. WD12.1]|nr:hypothetical protein [Bartonella sp. WD12.1]